MSLYFCQLLNLAMFCNVYFDARFPHKVWEVKLQKTVNLVKLVGLRLSQ